MIEFALPHFLALVLAILGLLLALEKEGRRVGTVPVPVRSRQRR